ncbi:DUF58 domain-containing protein [Flocculibacter collagenilyticus]|uniref:DUF58 domain-containing protein n=1 Tax=Flocculibacter collagenilyticus TaxID=2744479 RepID=UPI0018F5F680|nr:DUF58 domain-containing protein [Flocculibacter collagenilyticus]
MSVNVSRTEALNNELEQQQWIKQWQQFAHCQGANLTLKELLYYQSKTQLLDLKPKHAIQSKLAGNYLAKSKGRGMEFDEVRHYQPGDDIRTIDWRVTARTGKTHTKLFREEMERPVFILCDLSSSMFFGSKLLLKSVQAAHLTALIAWSAKQRGDKIGGLIVNQFQHLEFKPKSRSQAVLQLLHGLIELHQHGLNALSRSPESHNADLFEDACQRLRRIAKPGALVYVISDFYHLTENALKNLAQIKQHCDLIACEVTDPMEHQLPSGKFNGELLVNTGDKKVAINLGNQQQMRAYENEVAASFTRQQQLLKKHRIGLQHFTSASPLEIQLRRKINR